MKSSLIFWVLSVQLTRGFFTDTICVIEQTRLWWWFPHDWFFFSRKKVMMYLIDHNIIRLFSLLLCPCSSLEVYFWPWWKLALSIFKQTQKDNEWQKQVVLLLHDGTDDMFFFLRLLFTIHYSTYNPSRASQFFLLLCHLSIFFCLWPSIRNLFLEFF